MKSFKKIKLGVGALLVCGGLVAQYNSLDLEKLINGSINSLAFQADGQMIVVGNFDGHIARISGDGQSVIQFPTPTVPALFNAEVNSVVVDSTDAIVVGGKFTNFNQSIVGYLAKLDAQGGIDQTFLRNMGTGFDDAVNSLLLQKDGKLLVVGAFQNYNGMSVSYIARLHSDGRLDESFDTGSGFDQPVNSISMAKTGLLSVGGHFTEYNGETAMYFVKLSSSGQREM